MKKKLGSLLLAACMVLSLTMTACAAQEVPEADGDVSPVSVVSQELPSRTFRQTPGTPMRCGIATSMGFLPAPAIRHFHRMGR